MVVVGGGLNEAPDIVRERHTHTHILIVFATRCAKQEARHLLCYVTQIATLVDQYQVKLLVLLLIYVYVVFSFVYLFLVCFVLLCTTSLEHASKLDTIQLTRQRTSTSTTTTTTTTTKNKGRNKEAAAIWKRDDEEFRLELVDSSQQTRGNHQHYALGQVPRDIHTSGQQVRGAREQHLLGVSESTRRLARALQMEFSSEFSKDAFSIVSVLSMSFFFVYQNSCLYSSYTRSLPFCTRRARTKRRQSTNSTSPTWTRLLFST